ncbi:hypothetical protein HDU67_003422, partial [Dinochytrium kinnereticum]
RATIPNSLFIRTAAPLPNNTIKPSSKNISTAPSFPSSTEHDKIDLIDPITCFNRYDCLVIVFIGQVAEECGFRVDHC